MNKRYVLISVAAMVSLLLIGARAVAKEPPGDEQAAGPAGGGPGIGEPGLSFRYVETFGVTEQAYIADAQHLNGPNGLFIDGSNNVYVVEELGFRMLKLNSAGVNQLIIGGAGQPWHHDDYLAWPKDVVRANDGHIWIAISHALKEFDVTGNLVQIFPETDPSASGTDNDHFNEPRGIAFDSTGRMYVSDDWNHRIQVYTFTVDGSPVYSTTIGVTGTPGSNNAHFNRPFQIVIDSSDRLYVADVDNFRVQRCTYAAGWTCSIFHGGNEGSGIDQLSWLRGLGIDSSDNIYIADAGNGRIKKCSSGGSCSVFTSGLDWPNDAAVDSVGNVYVSDFSDSTIRKYNSSGNSLGVFAGTSGVPYVTDNNHFNALYGVAVDGSGNIILTEERGHRLLKLNSSGVAQWSVGEAGITGSDNAHFSRPRGAAVDSNGNIYVAEHDNHRVQIYDSSGNYVATLGTGWGTGNYQFSYPSGVTIGPSGHIYVADTWNHRIQIYNSSRIYVATLGITGSSGSDNTRFNAPHGVFVDSDGNIYVPDSSNQRVQVFDSNRAYQRTIGTTGEKGDDFAHFNEPLDVAVDGGDNIYVADVCNHRIQVFDNNGAYLTTIGGGWGSNTGQLRDARGVDVDLAGNVYVADGDNTHIKKFAPGVPGWEQVNINGFGNLGNKGVSTLAVFGDALYAGTGNDWDQGGEIWRYNSGSWERVVNNGFGVTQNNQMRGMAVWDDYLYVGTSNENGGEIWRSDDGIQWTQVVSQGFGDANNVEVNHIVVFSDMLYADTVNLDTGAEVWRSSAGATGTWTQANADGFSDVNNETAWFMTEFKGDLYVGTVNGTDGGEIWRSGDGLTWERITEGFGDTDNEWVYSFAVFQNNLYASTVNWANGGQIWRSSTGNAGDWTQVASDGFSDANNEAIRLAAVHDGYLYATTANWVTGEEVWHTADGTIWEQVNIDGFGDSNNFDPFWNNASAVFNDSLYLGTWNSANGGEVWHEIVDNVTPLALSADSGYASIQLSWNPANGSDVTSYRISRRPSGSSAFTVIATVNDTVYFDSDASLTPGASYCYQVEALKSGGTVAGTSNTACATFGKVDLWVPDTWAAPGDTVIVPVNIRNANGLRIAAGDIWLDFDPTVIEPVDVSSTALTEQYAWAHAVHSSGTYSQVRISTIASPPPVLYGDGSLFWFTFNVLGSADDTSPLDLREFIGGVGGSSIQTLDESENPEDVPLFLQDGMLYVATTGMLGDLDDNGVVQAVDAYLALQMAVGKKTPNWRQQYAGDVNGDGVISSADVTMILYYAAHQQWPVPSGSTRSSQAISAGPLLSLDDVSGVSGAIVTTTLRASDLQDWAGGDWVIAYDPVLVEEIIEVNAAGLSAGAPLQFHDDGVGLLRIAVAKDSAVSGDDALATISLQLSSAPARDEASLTMATAKLNDVYGRDFSTSALQRTIERQNGTISITSYSIYLPLVLRDH